MWTFDEAIKTIRFLEPRLAAVGFHCALTGSVLYKGESKKDLDIMVYPHTKEGVVDFSEANDCIAGCLQPERFTECKSYPGGQERDEKTVYCLRARGKRIDFFFVS